MSGKFLAKKFLKPWLSHHFYEADQLGQIVLLNVPPGNPKIKTFVLWVGSDL